MRGEVSRAVLNAADIHPPPSYMTAHLLVVKLHVPS